MLQLRWYEPQLQQHMYMFDSAARALDPSQHRHCCRIPFHLLVFQIPCPLHHPILTPLLSSPHPTPPFIPLLALPPAAASKPLTASGEMADWKYTSCPSIIGEVGEGGVHGGETGGMEREKQSGIKKGEGKDNLRDRHRHKSPERGSKRLHRI